MATKENTNAQEVMNELKNLSHKINIVLFISAMDCNPNGDPANDNIPRRDFNDYGVISSECLKRKIRNILQELGFPIFVQTEGYTTDGCKCLKERAEKELGSCQDKGLYAKTACEKWIDVRAFGQAFAFSGTESDDGNDGKKSKKRKGSVSVSVRGPVSVMDAKSIDKVRIQHMQITKSCNGNEPNKDEEGNVNSASMSSDRMGMRHKIEFGLYKTMISMNVQLSEKTGFNDEDAKAIEEAVYRMFEIDASSARPEGTMAIEGMYIFDHNCINGQYSPIEIYRSVEARNISGAKNPRSMDDYEIIVHPLENLTPEIRKPKHWD